MITFVFVFGPAFLGRILRRRAAVGEATLLAAIAILISIWTPAAMPAAVAIVACFGASGIGASWLAQHRTTAFGRDAESPWAVAQRPRLGVARIAIASILLVICAISLVVTITTAHSYDVWRRDARHLHGDVLETGDE